MGIKGLKQFLKSKFPQCIHSDHLYHHWGEKAIMDLLPYLYRYKVSHGDKWLEGLFTLLTTFIKHNVHLTVIMDGPMVYKEKEKERAKRKQGRDRIKTKLDQLEFDLRQYDESGVISELLYNVSEDSSHRNLLLSNHKTIRRDIILETIQKLKNQMVSITPEDISIVQELCSSLSLNFLFARQEAESFASYLCANGFADIVITEDTDVLPYGCPRWLSTIAHDGSCMSIHLQEVLSTMKFTHDQFIDFCILCGTDYNETIKGVGPVSSYSLLSSHSLEKVNHDTSILNYTVVRDIFKRPCQQAIISPLRIEPYSVTIPFNPLPIESRIHYPFSSSFKKWIRSYEHQFILD
jgi:5'-3' exonuclease